MYKNMLYSGIGLLAILLSSFTTAHAVVIAPIPPPPPMEVGGANYVMWDLGNYLTEQTEASWYSPHGVKPVIGTFHQNPSAVRNQLQTIYDSGQRKIALMLWYASMPRDTCGDVYGHLVSSQGARLSAQHEQNLRDLLGLIRAIGFTHLQFRFATQGSAYPSSWVAWDEAYYQESWNFIVNTRMTIEEVLGGSNVRRVYDLDAELGGTIGGQAPEYQKRLWSDYTFAFGKADTYGFSIAYAPGRLQNMIVALSQTGSLPDLYAFDIYGDEYSALKRIAFELSFDSASKPIIIQEAFYNDGQTKDAAYAKRADLGLNIRYIMQWPNARASGNVHFSLTFAESYDFYRDPGLLTPQIFAAGTGCGDQNCIWIRGGNLYNDTLVQIRSLDNTLLGQYEGSELVRYTRAQDQIMTLRLREESSIANLKYHGGVAVYIYSPVFSSWSAGYVVQGVPPQINSLGLGCAQNPCIWVSGAGFSSSCRAHLYPGDWSTGETVIDGTEYGLYCSDALVTFEIPPAIRAQYPSLNVLIQNKNTNMWAEPRLLTIR